MSGMSTRLQDNRAPYLKPDPQQGGRAATSTVMFDPPSLMLECWRMPLRDGIASAEIWKHPLGFEIRALWDTSLPRSQVYRRINDVEQDAADTRERLRAYVGRPAR